MKSKTKTKARKKKRAAPKTPAQRRATMTGTSNRAADAARKAKHPGKRKASSGKKYTERRRNRSDANRATGL